MIVVSALILDVSERLVTVLTLSCHVEHSPILGFHGNLPGIFTEFTPKEKELEQRPHVLDERILAITNINKHPILKLIGKGNAGADCMIPNACKATVFTNHLGVAHGCVASGEKDFGITVYHEIQPDHVLGVLEPHNTLVSKILLGRKSGKPFWRSCRDAIAGFLMLPKCCRRTKFSDASVAAVHSVSPISSNLVGLLGHQTAEVGDQVPMPTMMKNHHLNSTLHPGWRWSSTELGKAFTQMLDGDLDPHIDKDCQVLIGNLQSLNVIKR